MARTADCRRSSATEPHSKVRRTSPRATASARPAIAILAAVALTGLTQSAVAESAAAPPGSDATLLSDAPVAIAPAAGEAAPESWAIHGQATNVWQYHPAFTSRIPPGAQSLDSGSRGNETVSVSLFGGVRLWPGAEAWVNPEIDQGFGLSDTFGIAGFPNGESFKVGARDPYVKLPRLFLRQTIDLGGNTERVESDLDVLGGVQKSNRIVVTIGKFSVVDVFDTNRYAHDPRGDFMNWTIMDAGAFDYASDAWGFTAGAAVEWYQDWWTIRAGLFDGTTVPGSKFLSFPLGAQTQGVVELEARYALSAQPGAVRLLFAGTRARLASYDDAIANGIALGEPATGDGVRRLRNKGTVALNLEQQIHEDLGVFARASREDGGVETYDFTDVTQSVNVGVSLAGTRWRRPDDTVGLAGVINLASRPMRAFLAAGGLDVLIGDGQLHNSGPEQIIEAYYSCTVVKGISVTADYQFVHNPAYNRDRGPVSVFGGRLHVEF
jgi:high affinity Mn2+ porin